MAVAKLIATRLSIELWNLSPGRILQTMSEKLSIPILQARGGTVKLHQFSGEQRLKLINEHEEVFAA